MELKPLHITNAQLIDGDAPRGGSLLVVDGRIAAIDPTEIPGGTETIDAKGQWLAPGIIDLGVFATDKPAFHFGGITRAALMPDNGPLDGAGLVERAAKGGKPDLWVHPLAAATKGLAGAELAEIGLMKQAGARAIATGRSRITDSGVMRRVLAYAASLGLVTIIHAEDEGLTAGAVATDGEMATRLGLASAPAIAEAMAIARDLALVEETGAPVHFRQVTTARGFDLIRAAKAKGLPASAASPPRIFCSPTPRSAISALSPACRRRCARRMTGTRAWPRSPTARSTSSPQATTRAVPRTNACPLPKRCPAWRAPKRCSRSGLISCATATSPPAACSNCSQAPPPACSASTPENSRWARKPTSSSSMRIRLGRSMQRKWRLGRATPPSTACPYRAAPRPCGRAASGFAETSFISLI
jgi:hypothetical protein